MARRCRRRRRRRLAAPVAIATARELLDTLTQSGVPAELRRDIARRCMYLLDDAARELAWRFWLGTAVQVGLAAWLTIYNLNCALLLRAQNS